MENEFRKCLRQCKLSIDDIDFTVSAIVEFEEYPEERERRLRARGEQQFDLAERHG